jgi:tetratricopeptide (TPR) repeat protein
VLRTSRVLVVGTARPALLESHERWGEGLEHHVRLPLQPLSRRESARLLEEILQRADQIPGSLADLLVSTAEGNPFHLEELVKWLVDSEVIVKDGDVWHVHAERIHAIRVPPTLKGVLQSRIDALTAPEHLVLQRASVIGRVFWDDAVDALSTAPPPGMTIAEALDRLRSREIVYQRPQSAFDATEEFLFKHAVLRDVTYDSVLRSHRQQYHARAARWLEQMTQRNQRADEYAALIAGHYDNSGEALAAAHWYFRAARQASSVHALGEATRLLDRAADVVPDDQTQLRFDILAAREEVFDRVGDREAQRRDLDALDQLAPLLDDARRIRLLVRWASWHFHHSAYDEQEQPARAAVELARAAGREDLEADALLWWGRGLTWKGAHEQAKHVLEQALAKARATQQLRLVGESLRYLAIVANNESEFPRAIVLLEQAGAAHRANNDLEGESTVLVQLGSVLFNQGRHREAREWLEQSLSIFVASGHKYRQAVVTSNLGAILLQEGELGAARRLIAQGLHLCSELEDREGVAVALALLGETLRRAGDHERAQDYLRRSLDAAREITFDFQASDAALSLGLDLIDVDRADDAVVCMDQALEHARHAQSPLAETRAHLGRAFALTALGRLEAAGQDAHAARDGAKRLALRSQVLEADAALARIAQRAGDTDGAVRLVEPMLGHVDDEALESALRPGELLLACWQILDEAADPRATEALWVGVEFLDRFAERIDEADLREGFRTGIPAHRALSEARHQAPAR